MIIVNTDYISGKDLEMLGLVKGALFSQKTLDVTFHRALRL